MPFYKKLKKLPSKDHTRIASRLLDLKEALAEQIPKKTLDNILLATWNIREFDSRAYGDRMVEAIYYIAEIIDHFDLVAIQEVRDNLEGLRRLMAVLGSDWDVIFTDVTEGRPGNRERMAFVYDKRKVKFGGLVGEVVLPEKKDANGHLKPIKQLARSPFMVGFMAGWYRFTIVTVHLIYGKSGAEAPERVKEAEMLSDFLADKCDHKTAWSNTMVLLGDFNIFKPNNATFNKIVKNFYIPESLQSLPSNVSQNKHYDQIAFRSPYLKSFLERGEKANAGVFNFFDYVYTLDDEETFIDNMGRSYYHDSDDDLRTDRGKARYYRQYWRTHQMSDHLPMWIQLPIDRSKDYLSKLAIPFEVEGLREKDIRLTDDDLDDTQYYDKLS